MSDGHDSKTPALPHELLVAASIHEMRQPRVRIEAALQLLRGQRRRRMLDPSLRFILVTAGRGLGTVIGAVRMGAIGVLPRELVQHRRAAAEVLRPLLPDDATDDDGES